MSNHDLFKRVLLKETEEPFIIAEIGQAHDGSLGQALNFIQASAKSGANAVKFQTHFAEEESSKYDKFRVPVFPQDQSRSDYWRRMEFSTSQWKMLASKAKEFGLVFLSSPFSNKAVETLIQCDVPAWKIASGELFNYPMLDRILETQQPLLISTGMSSWEEIDLVAQYTKGRQRVLFQCTTEYPSKPENIGLNNISKFKVKYPDAVVGLSDHSGEIYPSMSAFMLGARVFEVHVAWSKQMFGPDTPASLTFDQLSELSSNLASQHTLLTSPVDKNKMREEKSTLVELFGRGVYANRDIDAGEIICDNDVKYLKPSKGISARDYRTVLGSEAKVCINSGEPIHYDDIK